MGIKFPKMILKRSY